MGRETTERTDSLVELLRFEEANLAQLRLQQQIERDLPEGKPDALEPDIRTCMEMIRVWSSRLERERWTEAA